MNERKVEIAVGIMFFGAMVLLAYFTILLKNEFITGKDTYYISADFPAGNGIKKNEIVKVLGVSVGTVDDVKLINNRVIVSMKMTTDFSLYENYDIKIQSDGIMGGKFVDINPGFASDDNRFYKEIVKTEILKGSESQDLITALGELVAINKEGITESVSNVRNLTAKLNLTADKINSGQGTLGKLLVDDKIANQTNDVLTDARETLEDAREQAPVTSFIRAALSIF